MSHTSEDLYEVWQGQIEPFMQLGWRWIFLLRHGDFRQVHGCVDHGDHQWSTTWQKESPGLAQFDKEHFFGTQGPRYSTARHQSSSEWHAIVWSIVILFAERNFWLCVNRSFDTIFDPDLSEPNRIFGSLNLSIKIPFSNQFRWPSQNDVSDFFSVFLGASSLYQKFVSSQSTREELFGCSRSSGCAGRPVSLQVRFLACYTCASCTLGCRGFNFFSLERPTFSFKNQLLNSCCNLFGVWWIFLQSNRLGRGAYSGGASSLRWGQAKQTVWIGDRYDALGKRATF